MASVSPSVSQSTKYETAYAGRVAGGIYPAPSSFVNGNVAEIAAVDTSTTILTNAAGLLALGSGACIVTCNPTGAASYTLPTASALWTALGTNQPRYQQVGVMIPVKFNIRTVFAVTLVADTGVTVKVGSTAAGAFAAACANHQCYIVFTSPTAYTIW